MNTIPRETTALALFADLRDSSTSQLAVPGRSTYGRGPDRTGGLGLGAKVLESLLRDVGAGRRETVVGAGVGR